MNFQKENLRRYFSRQNRASSQNSQEKCGFFVIYQAGSESVSEPEALDGKEKRNSVYAGHDFYLSLGDESDKECTVLRWKIPKKLPLKEGKKHLAIQVDNFSKREKGSFKKAFEEDEGVWDSGRIGLLKTTPSKESVSLNLFGKKIQGRYVIERARHLEEKEQAGAKTKQARKETKSRQGELVDCQLDSRGDNERSIPVYWLIWKKGIF